ncbi:hypothetical protein MLD52_16305 [Puniceicoccaceae bacterium K14]|nr:hypothetical protein [Puniceicoccaceae bacterium K14]
MNIVILLYLVGAILLGVEILVPGGIIGAIGGALMIGGIAILFSEYGLEVGLLGVVVALVLVIITFVIEVKILPKTAFGKRFFLDAKIEGNSQVEPVENFSVGQECKTVTALAPSGFIFLDGKKVDATSRSGFIEANETVKVVGKDKFRILVSK